MHIPEELPEQPDRLEYIKLVAKQILVYNMRQMTEKSDSSSDTSSRRRSGLFYRCAAVLLLLQGVVMELGVFVAFLVLSGSGVDQAVAGQHFSFIVPYFQEHLYQLMVMSGVFGALRVIGAVGLLRLRVWGAALSVTNCVITLVLMIFMLPAGVADGVLSGGALVLIVLAYCGPRSLSTAD